MVKKMNVRALLAIMLILLAIAPIAPSVHATVTVESQWKQFNYQTTSIVIYDFDGDGVLETVTLPYYIIDNYVVVKSPYPQLDKALLLDANSDGKLELVIYSTQEGVYKVYNGTKEIGEYNLGQGTPVISISRDALAVGNKVLFNMTIYTFNDASQVYPVTANGKLYVLYNSGSRLYIEDTNNNKKTVYDDNIKVIGAKIAGKYAYIIGQPPLGGTIFIKYDLSNGTAQLTGFTTDIEKVWGYLGYEGAFIASAGNEVYKIYQDKVVLIYVGTPLEFDGSYMYIYKNGEIRVYSPYTDKTIKTVALPENMEPTVFGARYPYMAAEYSDGKTYVLSIKPPVGLYLVYPPTVVAGEEFFYSLNTLQATGASLMLDGKKIPIRGHIAVNTTGTHTFTAYATNGIISIEKEYKFEVKPRPLDIELFSSNVPYVFSDFNITIWVYDKINGSKLTDMVCTVVTPTGNKTAQAWTEVPIKLVPEDPTTRKVPISVICGDNRYYARTVHNDTIIANPVPPKLSVEYLGQGTLKVYFTSPDKTVNAEGAVKVYIDGKYITQEPVPATISGIPTGNHSILLEYIPNTPVFSPVMYNLKVSYYGNISQVPPQFTEQVITADVVHVINRTKPVTQTVTQTKYLNQTVPVEIPTFSMKDGIIVLTLGLVAGIAVGYGAAALRNKPSEIEETYEEPQRNTGRKEGEVELDNP